MIRKAVYYLMSFLLMLAVIGISINKHYSGNNLYSVSIFSEPESCCEAPCGCCNETTELLQITDVFLQSIFQFEHEVKTINLGICFNDFEAKFFLKENIQTALNGNKYLKYLRQNNLADLQCYIL